MLSNDYDLAEAITGMANYFKENGADEETRTIIDEQLAVQDAKDVIKILVDCLGEIVSGTKYKLYSFYCMVENSTDNFLIDGKLSHDEVQYVWDEYSRLYAEGEIEGAFCEYLDDNDIKWKGLEFEGEFKY